jgi:hypothetical protein
MRFTFILSVLAFLLLGRTSLISAQNISQNPDSVTIHYLALLEKFDFSKIELIPVYDCMLDEAEQFLNYAQLSVKKSGSAYNPEIFEKLKLETANQRIVLNSYLQSIDFWLYKRAMERLNAGDTLNAKSGFELSLRYNSFFVPSVYQLSKIAFIKRDYALSLSLIRNVAGVLYYDEQQSYLLDLLQKQQYEVLMNNAKARIDEGLYKEAHELLEVAEKYCQEEHFKHCNQKQLDAYFSLARQGLYQAFILVCKQSLEANKTLLAQSYLLNALEIRKKYNSQIVLNPAEKKYSNQIVSSLYRQASNLKLRKRDGEAQFYHSLADTLLAYTDEDLRQKWSQKDIQDFKTDTEFVGVDLVQNSSPKPIVNRFERSKKSKKKSKRHSSRKLNHAQKSESSVDYMILEGKQMVSRDRYPEALQMFLLAHESYRQKGQKFPAELDPLLESSAIACFSEPISKASFYLWNKNIREADSICNVYYKIAEDGNLLRLNGVNMLFESYRQKRLRQQCQLYQDSLDYTLYKARNLSYSSSYSDAMQVIDSFLQDTSYARECSISLSEIKKLKREIAPATDFQILNQRTAAACTNHDTSACIKGMVEKDLYVEKISGSLFRINAISSEQSLLFQKDTVGLRLLCTEWISEKRYDKAISCIKALRELGQDVRKTSGLQKQTGALMYRLKNEHKPVFIPDELKIDKYYRTLINASENKESLIDKLRGKLGI